MEDKYMEGVVLSKSRKDNNYCIVIGELNSKKLYRLVANNNHDINKALFVDRKNHEINIKDIIEFSVIKNHTHNFQNENLEVDLSYGITIKSYYTKKLDDFLSKTNSIFGDFNNFLLSSEGEQNLLLNPHSIILIYVENVTLNYHQDVRINDFDQTYIKNIYQGTFTYNGQTMTISVTDPIYERRLLKTNNITLKDKYLLISLSADKFNGHYFKFIASIM